MEVPAISSQKNQRFFCEEYVEDKETEHQLTVLKPQNKVRDVLPDVKQTYQTPFTYL